MLRNRIRLKKPLRWPIVLLVAALAVTACSSGSSSKFTDEQQSALDALAAAFEASDANTLDAFSADIVVPNLERWQESELEHQEALAELRDELPEGGCRTAVEELIAVEESQNVIRLRLIENYREEQFGLVADDTTEYGRSAVTSARQAEEAVLTNCGRSTVDPAKTATGTIVLTPSQVASIEAVQAAYAETSVAFAAVFSVTEFVSDVESLQAADVSVNRATDAAIAVLGEGPCRTALGELQSLEQQQADLRAAMIAAGEAGDLVTMFRTLGEYADVNSASEPYLAVEKSVNDNCGVEI